MHPFHDRRLALVSQNSRLLGLGEQRRSGLGGLHAVGFFLEGMEEKRQAFA